MFDAYRVGVTLSLTNLISPALQNITRQVGELKHGTADLQAGFGAARVAAAGFVSVLAGGAMLAGIANMARLGEKLVQQQAMLRGAGFDAQEVAKATQNAWDTVGKVRGSTASGNLHLTNDVRAVVGDIATAQVFLPDIARLARVRQAVTGHDGEEDMGKYATAAELRGRASPSDPTQFRNEMNMYGRMSVAFPGRITPESLRQMNSRSGLGSRLMDDDVYQYFAPALITETGSGDTAGTQIAAIRRQFINRTVTGERASLMAQAGLLENNGRMRRLTTRQYQRAAAHGEFTKFDDVTKYKGFVTVQPRRLIDQEGFNKRLPEWWDKHMNHGFFAREEARLQKESGNPNRRMTDTEKGDYISRMGMTEPGRRVMSFMTFNHENIAKDKITSQRTTDASVDELLAHSPTLAIDNLSKSFKNLGEALAAPAMAAMVPFMNRLADGITSITLALAAHPEAAMMITKVAAGIAAVLVVAGGIAVVGGALALVGVPLLAATSAVALFGAAVTWFGQFVDWKMAGQDLLVLGQSVWAGIKWVAYGFKVYVSGMVEWATPFLTTLLKFSNWFAENGGIIGLAIQGWVAAFGILHEALNRVVSWMRENVPGFATMVDTLKAAFSTALNALTSGLGSIISTITEWASNVVARIKGVFSFGMSDEQRQRVGPLGNPMGDAGFEPMAYHPPGAGQGAVPPAARAGVIQINNTMTMDSRVIHRSVTRRMADEALAAPAGRTGFDPRRSGYAPGVLPT